MNPKIVFALGLTLLFAGITLIVLTDQRDEPLYYNAQGSDVGSDLQATFVSGGVLMAFGIVLTVGSLVMEEAREELYNEVDRLKNIIEKREEEEKLK